VLLVPGSTSSVSRPSPPPPQAAGDEQLQQPASISVFTVAVIVAGLVATLGVGFCVGLAIVMNRRRHREDSARGRFNVIHRPRMPQPYFLRAFASNTFSKAGSGSAGELVGAGGAAAGPWAAGGPVRVAVQPLQPRVAAGPQPHQRPLLLQRRRQSDPQQDDDEAEAEQDDSEEEEEEEERHSSMIQQALLAMFDGKHRRKVRPAPAAAPQQAAAAPYSPLPVSESPRDSRLGLLVDGSTSAGGAAVQALPGGVRAAAEELKDQRGRLQEGAGQQQEQAQQGESQQAAEQMSGSEAGRAQAAASAQQGCQAASALAAPATVAASAAAAGGHPDDSAHDGTPDSQQRHDQQQQDGSSFNSTPSASASSAAPASSSSSSAAAAPLAAASVSPRPHVKSIWTRLQPLRHSQVHPIIMREEPEAARQSSGQPAAALPPLTSLSWPRLAVLQHPASVRIAAPEGWGDAGTSSGVRAAAGLEPGAPCMLRLAAGDDEAGLEQPVVGSQQLAEGCPAARQKGSGWDLPAVQELLLRLRQEEGGRQQQEQQEQLQAGW
jgi:hypothetical protein